MINELLLMCRFTICSFNKNDDDGGDDDLKKTIITLYYIY